ncbi:hypothetical protein SKAU_G00202120 [Synaphobranchus kaupii]|uniref:Transglutaminase-like domain-containing protein n=1 Tax=Synaphobranchus kaupii TaxID=118154 RepID=A0A9Q1FG65_SYNKA|nr:hypothetical protein SKAU_G00202120 [Synaphobranchus kaupii]
MTTNESVSRRTNMVKPGDTVEALVQALLKGRSGDLEKLRAIWMWVTHHIGIECEEVSGYSKGAGYKLGAHFSGNGDHAWNGVRLEGRWHLLDSTWGAGNTSKNSSKFKFEYNEFYFLTHPALFAGDHFPLDAKWQLLTPPISLKQFENTVHLRSGFYNSGLLTTHPGNSLIQSDGKTTVTVQSSSPALFLPKLNGQHNCGGIMTLRPDGMNLDVYPESTGLHTLEIFAKAGDSAKDGDYTLVCEYQLRCRAVARETRPPTNLDNPVGPSWLTERKGLLEPSQRDPVVFAADGRCSFGFRVAAGVHLTAKLSAAAFPVTDDEQNRHVFRSRRGDRVDHRAQVPKAGLYVFKVYTKDKEEAVTYDYACNYLVSCTNPKVRWPVYPLRYAAWKDQYELVEPLAGVLPANRKVQFKMRIPDVSQVSVGGEDTHDLSLDADGYWTGFYSTGGCKDVNVMIQVSPGDRSRSFVLNYQVEIQ